MVYGGGGLEVSEVVVATERVVVEWGKECGMEKVEEEGTKAVREGSNSDNMEHTI